jgi:hypothetical protein
LVSAAALAKEVRRSIAKAMRTIFFMGILVGSLARDC